MSREYNPISEALGKESKFLEEVKIATQRFFDNSDLEVLHKSKNREIKAYRDMENMVVYVMDKKDKKITINIEDIHEWNKDSSTKEIIYWQYKENQGKVEEDLHMHTVIQCDLTEVKKTDGKKAQYDTEKDFEDLFLSKAKTEEEKETFTKIISMIKTVFGEKFLSNKEFARSFLKDDFQNIVCTKDVGTIQQYTELLNQKGYLSEVYHDNFFTSLNKKGIPKYQQMLADWVIGMNGMVKACGENKHTSSKKAFEFNDLDNHVWTEKGNLVLTNQNIGFYFKVKDDNNFVVYFLDEDKSPNKIDKKLKEGTIKELKDVALKVENGEIVNLNYSLMYSFELDMEFSVKAMKEEGIFKTEYPVDITSYQYQKDYYAHRYGLSEFEFVAQAMMTLGGGFKYDKEKGNFIDDGVKYIPNLPKAKNTRNKTFKQFNYLYPKKISYLNADWLDGLKYAVEVLKRDMPKPVAFEGDDEQDALKKAIKYYEVKIAKLENNDKKPKV